MAIARITLSGQLYGSVHQNIIHFQKPDYVTADLATLASSFQTLWMDQYKNMWVAETTFQSIKAEQLVSGGVGDQTLLPISIVGGGINDRRVPLMMSQVVQLTTGLAGKKNRGRIYVGGLSVNAQLDGLLIGSHLTSMNAILTTLKGRWVSPNATNGWQLVIHGKEDDHTEFRVVKNMGVRVTPGSQRRRSLGVGI